MAGLPSPPNPAVHGDVDPSPFAWSPPGTAGRGQNTYQTMPSSDQYAYNTHPFAQYGPPSAHPGDPSAAGPSTVPTLTYTNASAYGPYGPQRRSPHSTNPSPPHQQSYITTGSDGYSHAPSGFPGNSQSPSKAALGVPMTPTSPTNKPYACRLCAYTSSRSHDLKRHMRTHTNERPYECEVCHRTFARKDAAKRHMAAKNCGANAPGAGLGTMRSRADGGPSGSGKGADGTTSSEEQSDDDGSQSGEGDALSSAGEQMQVDGVEQPELSDPKMEDKTPTPPSATAQPSSSLPYLQQRQGVQPIAPQPTRPPTRGPSDGAALGRRPGPGPVDGTTNSAPARSRGPSYSRPN
ncbi:hypothetical protein CALCODRAFT_443950 [Calocera cornea HHB12733]|uniref:C2H2-type domain-containing protein n=2 Tax=Calocera TaxID=29888 RepID=A0A165CIJ7_9BASI|nr:hypothetical protein CALCODRAFT_443950 [Calocera cornea HHB12733]